MPNPYGKIRDSVSLVAERARTWMERFARDPAERIPSDRPEDKDRLATFVRTLWEDSNKWRQTSFMGRRGFADPMEFWRKARLIEGGLHWDVWGKRNESSDSPWKQEFTDDETENQVRMRKSFLGGKWHDITVSPNIDNINDILDDERKKTGWTDMTILTVHTGMVEGTAHLHEILDKTEDARGVSKTILADNASCFPTPFSTGLKKIEGCWYFCHATMQSEQQVLETYKDLNADEFRAARSDIANQVSLQHQANQTSLADLTHTKLCDVIAVWMDDPALEKIPSSDEEINAEHEAISAGAQEGAKVEDGQNHIEHIKKHLAWLEFTVNSAFAASDAQTITPENLTSNPEYPPDVASMVTEYTLEHILEHLKKQEVQKEEGIPAGYKRKYPYGRKVVVVSGVVAEDTNVGEEYGMDWRRLWRKVEVERLPGHYWGRGLVEVMWETNKVLDTMLSRTADIAITVGNPKPWFPIADKKQHEEQGYDNDPTKPGYYTQAAPTFPHASAPTENFQIYQAKKENAAKAFGVSDLSYGKADPGSSGKLVDILLQQMQTVVTGEANQRLNLAWEDIVETKLMMYRQFYTEPRWFSINGQPQAIVLSDVLKTFTVKNEQGVEEKKEVPGWEVTVAPNSNFPKAWEIALAFLIELSQVRTDDGITLVPRRAIAEKLVERYPELGPGGKYWKEAEATALGMQVLAEQEAKAKADGKLLNKAQSKFTAKGLGLVTGQAPPSTGGSNGKEAEVAR